MQFCFKVNVSTDRVGAVYKELAENESLQINKATLGDEFEYLYLDGIWQKTKSYGWTESNDPVIVCALGVRPDGSRKIIGFLLAREKTMSHGARLWEDYNNEDSPVITLN